MSTYPCVSDDDAKRFIRELDGDEPLVVDDIERLVGDGEPISLEPVANLYTQLLDLKRGFPDQLKQRDQEGGRFEREGCAYVHAALSTYPGEVLADPGFWRWLTVTQFAYIVAWRFGAQSGTASLANYGIGTPEENLLYRMWLRGDIGYDPNESDPYQLAYVGDQDLWRSHIIRQRYGNARDIARSLLRLQAGKLGRERLDVNGIRELAKRLKRLHANVLFEVLPASRADELVLELSEDL